ncbi:MAG: calcineurin-like phosphoesterase C-terminal domain-containing protein [Bacteroidaceae bacterium]|nr:calcineurin-like phosphoesterase C-terminal domain-containing protein [Bacteroidaceae bacterium]
MKQSNNLSMGLTLLLVWFSFGFAGAQNVTGRIVCGSKGVAGVAVSDGYELVLTDRDGRYALQSDKRNGYVFYTLPKGYEPEMKDGFSPQFWSRLFTPDKNVKEVHDFCLRRVRNNKYNFLIGADTHLANRVEDLNQFQRWFIPNLEKERLAAKGRPVYTMLLGDLTWDIYWTQNSYNLHDFLETCKTMGYHLPLWPVIGNHDNDPSVPGGPETDFLSSAPWRDMISPNYYSFNLGKIHIVVLDDIYYKNEDTGGTYAQGVAGSRNYDGFITEEQLAWLRKDLSLIKDKKTPIIVALHIPVTRLSNDFETVTDKMASHSTLRLLDELKAFRTVHVVSGHTHYNYTTHPREYPNTTEHNIAAVCATWWNTGHLTGSHLCKDGSPGGYSLWEVKGRKLRWQYHSMAENGHPQMRVYDMNAVRDFYLSDPAMKAIVKKYPERTNYGLVDDNLIYVNVFSYDDDWKVEILENGRPLKVERIRDEDPAHTLAYDRAIYQIKHKVGAGSATNRTLHLFKAQASEATTPVTVRVTDSFGQVYEENLQRPKAFHL